MPELCARSDKELKAFGRVTLEPGQSEAVSFTLVRDAMSFFDPAKDDWVAEAGDFEVLVGASSRLGATLRNPSI